MDFYLKFVIITILKIYVNFNQLKGEIEMYIVIERGPNSFLQTEYHIQNENQMKQFLIQKDFSDVIFHDDFQSENFRVKLESLLNDSDEDNQYHVVHLWLH